MAEFLGCTVCRKRVPAGSLFRVHGRGVCSECYKTLVNEANNRFISIVNWNPWESSWWKPKAKSAARVKQELLKGEAEKAQQEAMEA